ncbi:MAG TPA: RlmE family RNA methyltransferase [Solirubrobacterales bacterium]|nr:RlmE family RNA methyltransferase [Solirubrobacterales bacterium]
MSYRRKDAYYLRARAAGYRARSAYKLLQLNSRFRLLRRGDVVVDLGAWPGGWLQVALEAVGAKGRVVGVDLVAIDPLPSPNLRVVGGDVQDPSTWRTVLECLGRPADVVLSDLAPKLTGIRETDDARSAELVAAVLEMLPTVLRRGGNLLIKLFMGGAFELTAAELHRCFEDFRTTRPEATRKGSAELYGAGRGYRGPHAS